ncbi:polymerase/histidinol phosphatase-like protein [Paenibacillus sp. 32O-W]|uniref:TIGR00375 family protein n=1 Tax=Paenibacillus cisolokensis TaxID=1658519 RepID=A0ABQ4NFT5_9BACL|nr:MULTISPECIES: endonuclease Q family protein [Paenibacillus]ALS28378.1 polymerase/histidinol phosphatase-like protein [Paenibacillus sp. 32O-W]GIQ66721.1 hypothetical protein PACILC2_52890 [Paenibacillus cisolokensis]
MTGAGGLSRIFADLHIHIGCTDAGEPVKISASREMTFRRIAREAAERKGIGLIGVIDAHSPGVQDDIMRLLDRGEMEEVPDGGIRYRQTTILLGAEIEVKEPARGPAHYLVFLPRLSDMSDFTRWMERRMRNVRLSSQRLYAAGRELQREVRERGGLFIPAHIFTPHKSLFGSSADRVEEVLDPELIDAVELGLSADTEMAGWVADLDRYPFLTNSDAHSPAKIGREYNALRMAAPTFAEFRLALLGRDGRGIEANYGLQPRLGKYHRTACLRCGAAPETPDSRRCAICGGTRFVRGVSERIRQLASLAGRTDSRTDGRPPYIHQVPLEFVPGVGPAALNRLLERFGSEMEVLHRATPSELAETIGPKTAGMIVKARAGLLALKAGGGGHYGGVITGTSGT